MLCAAHADVLASQQEGGWGWYLYGVTRRRRPGEAAPVFGVGLDGQSAVVVLPFGSLAAVVSRVPLAALGAGAIQARLRDASWLEAMVRGHQRIVEAAHRAGAILPAKFGSVYAEQEDLIAALKEAHDALLARVERIAGCDEWGVRLYAHRPTMERRAGARDSIAQQLQQDIAAASPGRAYFLRRKLAAALIEATDQALGELAQAGYDCLAGYALAGQVSRRPDERRGPGEEVEVLRATFLVSRTVGSAFEGAIHRFTGSGEGLRCEYSGPWAPYSFVGLDGHDPGAGHSTDVDSKQEAQR